MVPSSCAIWVERDIQRIANEDCNDPLGEVRIYDLNGGIPARLSSLIAANDIPGAAQFLNDMRYPHTGPDWAANVPPGLHTNPSSHGTAYVDLANDDAREQEDLAVEEREAEDPAFLTVKNPRDKRHSFSYLRADMSLLLRDLLRSDTPSGFATEISDTAVHILLQAGVSMLEDTLALHVRPLKEGPSLVESTSKSHSMLDLHHAQSSQAAKAFDTFLRTSGDPLHAASVELEPPRHGVLLCPEVWTSHPSRDVNPLLDSAKIEWEEDSESESDDASTLSTRSKAAAHRLAVFKRFTAVVQSDPFHLVLPDQAPITDPNGHLSFPDFPARDNAARVLRRLIKWALMQINDDTTLENIISDLSYFDEEFIPELMNKFHRCLHRFPIEVPPPPPQAPASHTPSEVRQSPPSPPRVAHQVPPPPVQPSVSQGADTYPYDSATPSPRATTAEDDTTPSPLQAAPLRSRSPSMDYIHHEPPAKRQRPAPPPSVPAPVPSSTPSPFPTAGPSPDPSLAKIRSRINVVIGLPIHDSQKLKLLKGISVDQDNLEALLLIVDACAALEAPRA